MGWCRDGFESGACWDARDAMRNALVDSYIANLRMDRFHQLVITRRTSAGVVSLKWAHKTEIRQELRHIKEAEKS